MQAAAMAEAQLRELGQQLKAKEDELALASSRAEKAETNRDRFKNALVRCSWNLALHPEQPFVCCMLTKPREILNYGLD